MSNINHNVPVNKLLVVANNINIEPCIMCEAPSVLQRYGSEYFCHNCLIDEGFLKCCRCEKYVEADLMLSTNHEYLNTLLEYELQDDFICEDCSTKQHTNVYELKGDDLLEALGINTQSIADFRDEIIQEVGGF